MNRFLINLGCGCFLSYSTDTFFSASVYYFLYIISGTAFEKRVTSAVKHSSGFRTSSVKTQVPTKHHGRADIVARTKSGQKVVIEAKNYRGNPVTKDNVKQVKGYAKDLKAKPMLVVSKTTTVPSTVRHYANQSNVPIIKK